MFYMLILYKLLQNVHQTDRILLLSNNILVTFQYFFEVYLSFTLKCFVLKDIGRICFYEEVRKAILIVVTMLQRSKG